MKGYSFDEAKHCHTLDGKVLLGVTSVLGKWDKGGLIAWAWKLGKEGRDYKTIRDKAGDKGKEVHAKIELAIKDAIEYEKGMMIIFKKKLLL